MADKQSDTLLAAKVPKHYGRVIINLENCLLPPERLACTASCLDGLDPETEMDLRILGCELIQTAGILLRLPQVAMATGQVLFHRFYHSKSFVRQPMEITAMGCLCCASKVEEAPRRIRDVISVFEHIKQVRGGKTIEPVLLDQGYINLKNQVIKAERRVLKELGFCVHVKHPHKIVVMYLQILGFEKHKRLVQLSWNYMNDSLRTDVFVRFSPETIACACIYLSARKLGIVLPKKPAWYLLFGSVETDLKDISIRILKLYARAKPDADQLDKIVSKLEQAYQESRQRLKQAVQEGGASGVVSGGTATPIKNENHSTFSPGVAVAAVTQQPEINKGISVDSAGSTPSSLKGEEKNHVTSTITKKSSRVVDSPPRSPSLSPSEKQGKDRRRKSRHHSHHHHHHRKKRSRSRSRSRSRDDKRREQRERGDRAGNDKDNKRKERESTQKSTTATSDRYGGGEGRDRERDREKERDYKYRSKDNHSLREEKRDSKKERSRHRDRSLSRDRRR